jgi:hypothetical protein
MVHRSCYQGKPNTSHSTVGSLMTKLITGILRAIGAGVAQAV